jgi:hypothetical protein
VSIARSRFLLKDLAVSTTEESANLAQAFQDRTNNIFQDSQQKADRGQGLFREY